MITYQEALDKVWQYFLVEKNVPGYDFEQEYCLYNNGDVKCAIGCLIPDDKLHYLQEYTGVGDQPDEITDLLEGFQDDENNDLDFWNDLQQTHDDSAVDAIKDGDLNPDYFRKVFKHRLTNLASEFNLVVPT